MNGSFGGGLNRGLKVEKVGENGHAGSAWLRKHAIGSDRGLQVSLPERRELRTASPF